MATETLSPKKVNWFVAMMSSSLGRKLIMALTGLFLILFLVVHLIGNLQLLKNDNGEAFNKYAEFMGHNPLIQTVSIGNFFFIFLHIVYALMLTLQNAKARPQAYAYSRPEKGSAWSSRNMGILGTIILIFLVVHLQNFWFQAKFGFTPEATYGTQKVKDLYQITATAFSQLWLVALYLISMVGLAFHLSHGFQSAFQTLGLNHIKYNGLIKTLGLLFSILVPAAYAAIPLLMYLKSLN